MTIFRRDTPVGRTFSRHIVSPVRLAHRYGATRKLHTAFSVDIP
jgi:hypothetical protein